MFVVHGTKKFRERVKRPLTSAEEATTTLGNWYATVLFWRPQVALFVNEPTLLPVLMPLAPAAKVLDRFPEAAAWVFQAHGLDPAFIEREVAEMANYQLAKTTNRSVVGIMNEFTYLGGVYRTGDGAEDLIGLSLWLAHTPCSPLYGRHVSPDRALAATVAHLAQ